METAPQIIFENMDSSDAVRARIESEIAKLEQFHNRITACRVNVTAPDRHKTKGGLYRVKIFLTVPTGDVVVDHSKPKDHAHEDVYVAIRDSFSAARRQLQDRHRIDQGEVKVHEGPPTGRIKVLNGYEDYGFIEADGGYDVYFHRNAVVTGDFDKLQVGDQVRFHEEIGAQGPQASTVHVMGKQQHT